VPDWREEILKRISSLRLAPTREAEIIEELSQHLEERYQELIAGGTHEQDARRMTLAELSDEKFLTKGLQQVEREAPQEPVVSGGGGSGNLFAGVWQDIRYGLRMLAKNPGFTATAVLTLALGIGANTAIFTVINAVLLSSLPVGHPEQLVVLTDPNAHGMKRGNNTGDRDLLTYAEFEEIARRNRVLSGVFSAASTAISMPVGVVGVGEDGSSAQVDIGLVSGSYFAVLGVKAIIGRMFTADVDKVRDANPVVVISYNFWQSRFGGDPSVLGRKLRMRKTTYDIIGVAPRGFFGETVGFAPDVWAPLSMQAEFFPGEDWLSQESDPLVKTTWLQVIGRLKPDVALVQANASLNVTFQQYLQSQLGTSIPASERKNFLDQHLAVTEGGHGASAVRAEFGKPLLILMGVVGLVLLVACANVANLLLARATSRRKEIAVRIALGAGRTRLFRQVLTESVLLASIGGAFGLVLARWSDTVLLRLVSEGNSPIELSVHPGARILAFTLGVSVLTGILFGLAPAFRASRVDLNSTLKGTSQSFNGGAAQGGPHSFGKTLVVAQVAVSLLLLIVAGLFIHSFRKLTTAELGYDRDHLLILGLNPLSSGYKGPAIAQLYKDLLGRIQAIPGVNGVSLSINGLFSDSEMADPISIDGYTPKTGQKMGARFDQVGPNYFKTVGIPVLIGREFGPEDEGGGQRVGVINQTMARYYFGDENPIGRRIWDAFPSNRQDFVVVGVVADAKYNNIREEIPRRFYVPFFHPIVDPTFASLEVRVAGNPAAVTGAIRAAVKEAAPNLPPVEINTMNELVSETLTRDRMITKLAGFFGVLAVLLACIGIYGIMAYAVAGRTNEIGIRMALGAQPRDVLWLVLGETLGMVMIGATFGLPAVYGASKLIGSLLFGLTAADPIALSVATVLIFAVASLAAYLPARRAARIDPVVALRCE
jgi:predicted permease